MIFKSKREQTQRDMYVLYKRVFRSPDGKLVLMDLMNKFFAINGIPEGFSDRVAAECEGKRKALLYILEKANINLSEYDKLLSEGDIE